MHDVELYVLGTVDGNGSADYQHWQTVIASTHRDAWRKMLGLELHRSWERLAALARALNGQRLLWEGLKLRTTAVEGGQGMQLRAEVLVPSSSGPQHHPQAIRLCDVVRTTCAGAG